MSDDKTPFLTVDYSKAEMPEEVRIQQENCEHKTLSILDVEPSILTNKYGIPFKRDIINYICEDCSKVFGKPKKSK